MQQRVPGLQLVLAGAPGTADAAIAAAIERCPSPAAVVLLGYVDDGVRAALLEHASLFAYPSLDEGFGLPLLEAMHYGVPIVASTAGAIPEIAGDAALLVAPTDTAALSDALERVLRDGDLRSELTTSGRRRCREFSWTACADGMVELYREALLTWKITVLCGGVGAARYLRGLLQIVPASSVTAIVNTGDDCVVHGLQICPDLDTVTYTLADAIDPARGWGQRDETWHSRQAMERYATVRPAHSSAANTWFGLGDKDLATHGYRTQRLDEGASLSEVTAEIVHAWGLELTLLPMANDPVPTLVSTREYGTISFQEYFVRHRHSIEVTGLAFAGADAVTAPAEVLAAIECADRVIIAPSNPLVSIGPLRAIPAIEATLRLRRADCVAISPLVGGKALKGPADRMLIDLGYGAGQGAVAELYRPIASTLLLDHADADEASVVSACGLRPVVTSTVMSNLEAAAALAEMSLSAR